jgi:hypothetical protein
MGIVRLKEVFNGWRKRRFLKKHGCETQEQYDRRYDPRVNYRASRIKDFYDGYAYISCFESSKSLSETYGDWLEGLAAMRDWCEENCSQHWRHDIHRVIKNTATSNEYEMNEIGGSDILFFAFENEQDCFLFNLKWS